MSDATIFAVGTVIFAVTIYGSLGSLLMLGLTRLEAKDKAEVEARPAPAADHDDAPSKPVRSSDGTT
jgi:hypothetical protein